MERCLHKLNYHFFDRNHIHSLLPNEPFVFCICTDKEAWIVRFSKTEFSFEKTDLLDEIDVKITTEKQIALELLSGNKRLSQLKKYNEIIYEGSFRHFLLLESVLWLCREYEAPMEAVSF